MYGQYTKELKDYARKEGRRHYAEKSEQSEDPPDDFETYGVSRCQQLKRNTKN